MKQSTQEVIKDELPEANYPDFSPGDKIRVETEEEIGGQLRKRFFEGICIGRKGEGIDQTFKVRKESFGVGIERIFPLYSPIIETIKVIRKGVVNQAKLNYLSEKSSKEARIDEKRVDLDEINAPASKSGKSAPEEVDESFEEAEEPLEKTGESEQEEQEEAEEEDEEE